MISPEIIVASFGETLRTYRQASNDPHRLNRRLSQERLGRLIGEEMGDLGFSGAAVAYWESGESRINAADRKVLLALIRVLYNCRGLKTVAEANQLLEMGNYRTLDETEARTIFPEVTADIGKQAGFENSSGNSFLVGSLLAVSQEELETLIETAKAEGPEPSWPRVLTGLMRKAADGFSITRTTILWVWVGVVAWFLIAPSLRLPFTDRSELSLAMAKYVIGSLVVPLAIGVLVDTKNNEYWKRQAGVNTILLRLYTYQGAGIGFNLGYFFIYPFALGGYYLNLNTSGWVEFAAVITALLLGNMGACVVPHNLWRAYERLKFSDGAIFFFVAFLGPLWGFFFLEFYSLLLAPATGASIILLAITFLVFRLKQKPGHLT